MISKIYEATIPLRQEKKEEKVQFTVIMRLLMALVGERNLEGGYQLRARLYCE